MLFALFVPDRVLLNFQSFRNLRKGRYEHLILGNYVSTFHAPIVDLMIFGFSLLENTRNDTLRDQAFTEIIYNYRARCCQTDDVQLINSLYTANILPNSYSGCFIATLRGKCANTVGSKRVENIVIDKDLCIPTFCRIQGGNLSTSDHHSSTGSCFVEFSKGL